MGVRFKPRNRRPATRLEVAHAYVLLLVRRG